MPQEASLGASMEVRWGSDGCVSFIVEEVTSCFTPAQDREVLEPMDKRTIMRGVTFVAWESLIGSVGAEMYHSSEWWLGVGIPLVVAALSGGWATLMADWEL